MLADVSKEGKELHIKILQSRLEGDNLLLKKLQGEGFIERDVEVVEFDFDKVDYLNSLGITEIVNIHRLYMEKTKNKAKFRFINVDKKVLAILELVELHKLAEIVQK